MYKICPPNSITNEIEHIQRVSDSAFIPTTISNYDYRQFLDDLEQKGEFIVDSEVPESILTHAAERKFKQQLNNYAQAVTRLSKYVLSEGRPEIKGMVPSGEVVFNERTGTYEDVLVERVTHEEIPPLPATVEVYESTDDPSVQVKRTIRNPLIIKDEEERAAAQAIVDATPEEVKVAAAGE